MKLLLLILSLSFYATAIAGDYSFTNIGQSDFENISKELSANFTHTSVSPAAALGSIWGVEAGLILGVTKTPDINKLVQEFDSSVDADMLPHAGLLAIVTIPFGITGELSFIPEQDTNDVEFSTASIAAKWTITNHFFSNPLVDVAIKGHLSSSSLSFKQVINNYSTSNIDVDGTIKFDEQVYGAHLVANAKILPIITPYIGIGFLRGKTELEIDATGTATIFDQSYSLSDMQKNEVTSSSSHFFLGAQFSVLLVRFGLEYSNLFGTNKYTGKFSLYF